ncbi:MAG: peptide chain release factor 3 [bacterium]
MKLDQEAARRRTFAIISHPDAGKTTLTEKLLLYANAIELAGSVRARNAPRHAISDWMKMEKERGISVTSSVLQFEYDGRALNLLDTPGHADFSEDTFRVLAAVDSAVMLMDHVKGVEPRTLKLFEVCRMRRLPVVTFMNKLDREGMEPFELLDDVSTKLDLKVAPLTWPIGMGRDFRGVVDIHSREVTLYDAAHHGSRVLAAKRMPWAEAEPFVGETHYRRVSEELELLLHAGEAYTTEGFLGGEVSPVFWGSAVTNFGVDRLLSFVSEHAAAPGPRATEDGETIAPDDQRMSGFVFKIQANMNPKHRDRIAFVRIVSGHFERGMDVTVGRSGETLRLSKPHSFLADERSIVDEAWPGDIVGVFDPGKLRVGDTIAEGRRIRFGEIPSFAPEHIARLSIKTSMKRKALDAGLDQLSQEGVIQLFFKSREDRRSPILGAVGLLQFEVLKERLKNEYDVDAQIELLPGRLARWVSGSPAALAWLEDRSDNYTMLEDRHGHPVVLVNSPFHLDYARRNAPTIELHEIEPK